MENLPVNSGADESERRCVRRKGGRSAFQNGLDPQDVFRFLSLLAVFFFVLATWNGRSDDSAGGLHGALGHADRGTRSSVNNLDGSAATAQQRKQEKQE